MKKNLKITCTHIKGELSCLPLGLSSEHDDVYFLKLLRSI